MSEYSEIEIKMYEKCNLCPRKCGVNRLKGELGVCKMGTHPMVARAALHFWEEPGISGEKGSGAVFFSGCNLHCVFCQNREISHGKVGKVISKDRLSEIFLDLQKQGANNINLVTAFMFIPTVVEALKHARKKGLSIPVVYNTSGYESVEALRLLRGYVDIYLPDFKYLSKDDAQLLSGAKDYPEVAKAAIDEMYQQVQEPVIGEDGLFKSGLIVRHLVLPNRRKETEEILDCLFHQYQNRIFYSVMNQYTPVCNQVLSKYKLDRRVTSYEYQKVIDHALEIGIVNGYMQEGKTASESFIPAFDLKGV